jgi:N-methylhydantoinase B
MTRGREIRLQVMWRRLLAIVEEQAQTLVRTASSTASREAGDISAGIFDPSGRMLAQAVTGTPGHINAMALSVGYFLERFPLASMREGDVFLTNDPWKGTGHLNDFTFVTPAFKKGRLVALFAATSHVVDIGGIGQSPDGRQVFEEGLLVPIGYFAQEGRVDAFLLDIVRANVREPVQVTGDLYALAAANEAGERRLIAMMEEYALEDLDELASFILSQSERAMVEAIALLPRGRARNTMTADGLEAPIDLVASLAIEKDRIRVDFAGTSPASDFGINCPLNYTIAYTAFGIKCVVAPKVPNNAGSLLPIEVSAPEGSILNAPYPAAVAARSTIGQMLPDVVFGCFEELLPGRVPAEGTSCLWNIRLGVGHGISARPSRPGFKATNFQVTSFHSGGTGARPNKDGLSATPFPSGVKNVPVEITEAITPIVVWRKEYRIDSGGAGRWRGGLGQVMEIGNREPASFALLATFDRTRFAPRGRRGGGPGALGRVRLASGALLNAKGRQNVPEGDIVIVEMPGGGGYGDPKERDGTLLAADIEAGLVSREAAERDYGIAPEKLGTEQKRRGS